MAPPMYTNNDRPFNAPTLGSSSPFDRRPGGEVDMSPPIDDGSSTPSDDPSQLASDRSSAPRSPAPRLVLFDARTGQQETIDLSAASSVMTLDDYKRLNRRTTERGMVSGLLGGGAITYLVKRFMPKSRAPSRNALALTFIFSASLISFTTSRALLVSEILSARARARQRAIDNGELDPADMPQSPLSGLSGMGSRSDGAFGDSPSSLGSPEKQTQAPTSSAFPRPSGNVGNVGLGKPRWNPPPASSGGMAGPGSGTGFGASEGEMFDPYASNGR